MDVSGRGLVKSEVVWSFLFPPVTAPMSANIFMILRLFRAWSSPSTGLQAHGQA